MTGPAMGTSVVLPVASVPLSGSRLGVDTHTRGRRSADRAHPQTHGGQSAAHGPLQLHEPVWTPRALQPHLPNPRLGRGYRPILA